MKKFLLVTVLVLGLTLVSGCSELDPTEEDQTITVEVRDTSEEVLYEETHAVSGEPENALDALDETIDLDYTMSEYGAFVKGVAGHYPRESDVSNNYYYRILVDDAASDVGIDAIDFVDGMTITFVEATMLDDVDRTVDRAIDRFIDQHPSTYINDEDVQHYVLIALHQLMEHGYVSVDWSDLIESEENLDFGTETIPVAFKTALYQTVRSLDTSETLSAMESFQADNHYDAVSQSIGLSVLGSDSEKNVALKDYLIDVEPDVIDPDLVGMTYSALGFYRDDEYVSDYVDDMNDYLEEQTDEDGIVSWGNANSASTAVVIIGLVAQGYDPREMDVDLIEALLAYEVEGAFKWKLSEEEADLAFSTPQAFAALVSYKLFRDDSENQTFNLFD
ncbi:MAG: DUF4430 domain-containing protein [Acholeplasmataceae bacterium]